MIDKQLVVDKPIRKVSHLHLVTPITGVTLTNSWSILPLDTTNFRVRMMNGFTLDDVNDRVYWDLDGDYNESVQALFIGDAGLQVTAGISGTVTVTLGLFINGTLVLETPLNFSALNDDKDYGANGILVDASLNDLLQSGSYYDFRVKAGIGETPTITLLYFNTTIQGI